jgi:hypothetical protein
MPIWNTTGAASRTQLGTVPKTRVTTVTLNARGLMPLSTYTFWCNGVDMTWACRTPGTRQGGGLISDASGAMTVYFSAEITEDYTGAGDSTKYNSMQLKNLSGDIHSFSLSAQTLIGK